MKHASTIVACLLAMTGIFCAANARPNIVLILADDLGYKTIGATGGQSYATPRLTRAALIATGSCLRYCLAGSEC